MTEMMSGLNKGPAPPTYTLPVEVAERLAAWRVPGAYLVGGCLRDFLRGRPCRDFDILYPVTAARQAAEVARATGATHVILDGERDIHRLAYPDGYYVDVKSYQDIESEIYKADFTVNALLVNLATGAWEDRVGGFTDLRRNLIRLVSSTAFIDDPLRVLRAVRFSAAYGFILTPKTIEHLQAAAPEVTAIAHERVVDEIRRICLHHSAATAFRLMGMWGLLEIVFPGLTSARDFAQNEFHHLDVLHHSLESVRIWCEELLPSMNGEDGDAYLAEKTGLWDRRAVISLALLLHDIGKPATLSVDTDGRRHFYEHEKTGAALVVKELMDGGYPTAVADTAGLLVRQHMRAGSIVGGDGGKKALRRLIDETGEWALACLAVALADCLATRGPANDLAPDVLHARFAELHRLMTSEPEDLAPPRLITGHDILELSPEIDGPRIGELLAKVRDAQLNEEITDRAEALALLKTLLNQ